MFRISTSISVNISGTSLNMSIIIIYIRYSKYQHNNSTMHEALNHLAPYIMPSYFGRLKSYLVTEDSTAARRTICFYAKLKPGDQFSSFCSCMA